MRKLLIPGVFLASLTLAGCGSVERIPFVHRIDVQQGNVITQEQIDQLKPGMTTRQVRFTLGTPMIVDVFHQDRWDYVYYLKRGKGSETQSRKLVVFFKDNRLERFDSDPMPVETQADNLILGRNPKDTPKPPPGRTDSGNELPPPPTRQ